MTKPKYPNIKVKLTGKDGNAFAVMGRVTKALQRNGVSKVIQNEFFLDASSGNYDHVLQTAMKYVDVR